MAFKFIGNGIRVNETDVKVPVDLRKSVDATAETGATPGTFTAAWYHRVGGATPVTPITLVTMEMDGAHTPGGIAEIGLGGYELGLPDAAVVDGSDGVWVALQTASSLFKQFYPLNYDAVLRSFVPQGVAATTLTFDANASASNDAYNGTVSVIVDSTVAADLGAAFLCTAYVGASKVATGVWTHTPTGTPSSVICFADGYVAVGTKLSTLALSTQEKADAQQEAEDALAAYGATTPGDLSALALEATAAAAATPGQIPAQVVAGLTTYGAATPGDLSALALEASVQALNAATPGTIMDVNLTQINGTAVTGDGSATPWGPA